MLCELPTKYALVENEKIFFQVCTLIWRVDDNLHKLIYLIGIIMEEKDPSYR